MTNRARQNITHDRLRMTTLLFPFGNDTKFLFLEQKKNRNAFGNIIISFLTGGGGRWRAVGGGSEQLMVAASRKRNKRKKNSLFLEIVPENKKQLFFTSCFCSKSIPRLTFYSQE